MVVKALAHGGRVAVDKRQVAAQSGGVLLKGTHTHCQSVYYLRGQCGNVAANALQTLENQIFDTLGRGKASLARRESPVEQKPLTVPAHYRRANGGRSGSPRTPLRRMNPPRLARS